MKIWRLLRVHHDNVWPRTLKSSQRNDRFCVQDDREPRRCGFLIHVVPIKGHKTECEHAHNANHEQNATNTDITHKQRSMLSRQTSGGQASEMLDILADKVREDRPIQLGDGGCP